LTDPRRRTLIAEDDDAGPALIGFVLTCHSDYQGVHQT
jgi:hypothetical protein